MIGKFYLWHKKEIIRITKIIVAVIIIIIVMERLYNNLDVFQTEAMDAEYYGILDAGFTKEEKYKEFEYLYEFLEENYPFFKVNERLNKVNWLENKSKYKRILRNAKGDAEYLVAVGKILNDLHDSNTYVLTGDTYRRFYMYHYPNLTKVLNNPRAYARYNFNGDINNVVFDQENDLIYHQGNVLETKIISEGEIAYLRIKAMAYNKVDEDYAVIKDFLHSIKDYKKLIIDIRGNVGGVDDYWINLVKLLTKDTLRKEYYSFFKQNKKSILDDYQIQDIKTINNLDEVLLERFPKEIKEDFNFYKRNELTISPDSSIDFSGKVYLIVDEEVTSEAEKFAAFAKDTNFATLVGERTGGGMTFEEVPMVSLPYGGFIIRYSRELVMNSDGTINMEAKTLPDIIVEDCDIKANIIEDECIKAILQLSTK